MKIYKLEQRDFYGEVISDRFFLEKAKGIDEFNKKVEEYKNDEDLPTAKTLEGCGYEFAKEPIEVIKSYNKSVVKKVMVTLWERVSHEYSEWELCSRYVTLSEIEVE